MYVYILLIILKARYLDVGISYRVVTKTSASRRSKYDMDHHDRTHIRLP